MRITADTNLLVRVVVQDDPRQAKAAEFALQRADAVAIPVSSLCELAWVLPRLYRSKPADVAKAIRALINNDKALVDRPTIDAGLAALDAGGDFADGIIAFEGETLGGEEFVSFDKQAVALLSRQGIAARLLA